MTASASNKAKRFEEASQIDRMYVCVHSILDALDDIENRINVCGKENKRVPPPSRL